MNEPNPLWSDEQWKVWARDLSNDSFLSTVKAMRVAIEEAQAQRLSSGQSQKALNALVSAADEAVKHLNSKYNACIWMRDSNYDYRPSCLNNETCDRENAAQHSFRFCPYCGREIKIKGFETEEDSNESML
jgi:hypothetical protein